MKLHTDQFLGDMEIYNKSRTRKQNGVRLANQQREKAVAAARVSEMQRHLGWLRDLKYRLERELENVRGQIDLLTKTIDAEKASVK